MLLPTLENRGLPLRLQIRLTQITQASVTTDGGAGSVRRTLAAFVGGSLRCSHDDAMAFTTQDPIPRRHEKGALQNPIIIIP